LKLPHKLFTQDDEVKLASNAFNVATMLHQSYGPNLSSSMKTSLAPSSPDVTSPRRKEVVTLGDESPRRRLVDPFQKATCDIYYNHKKHMPLNEVDDSDTIKDCRIKVIQPDKGRALVRRKERRRYHTLATKYPDLSSKEIMNIEDTLHEESSVGDLGNSATFDLSPTKVKGRPTTKSNNESMFSFSRTTLEVNADKKTTDFDVSAEVINLPKAESPRPIKKGNGLSLDPTFRTDLNITRSKNSSTSSKRKPVVNLPSLYRSYDLGSRQADLSSASPDNHRKDYSVRLSMHQDPRIVNEGSSSSKHNTRRSHHKATLSEIPKSLMNQRYGVDPREMKFSAGVTPKSHMQRLSRRGNSIDVWSASCKASPKMGFVKPLQFPSKEETRIALSNANDLRQNFINNRLRMETSVDHDTEAVGVGKKHENPYYQRALEIIKSCEEASASSHRAGNKKKKLMSREKRERNIEQFQRVVNALQEFESEEPETLRKLVEYKMDYYSRYQTEAAVAFKDFKERGLHVRNKKFWMAEAKQRKGPVVSKSKSKSTSKGSRTRDQFENIQVSLTEGC